MLQTWCYVSLANSCLVEQFQCIFLCEKGQKILWGVIFPKDKQDQNVFVGPKPHAKQVRSVEITLLPTKLYWISPQANIRPR